MENNIKIMNELFLKARKENDTVVKNLLSTLKGEFENFTKNGNNYDDESLAIVVKKMIKSLELINNEQSNIEITVLKKLYNEISEDDYNKVIDSVLSSNPDIVESIKLNPAKIGILVGTIMKEFKNKADGKIVMKLLKEKLSV